MINENVRSVLIDLARKEKFSRISLQELSDKCHLAFDIENSDVYRSQLLLILHEISINEFKHDRPILRALVYEINKNGEDSFDDNVSFVGGIIRLKKENFHQVCFDHCIRFWKDDHNYYKYRNLKEE
jgi:hypothetical protein